MPVQPNDSRDPLDAAGHQIRAAIAGVRYGSVEIVIHDGRIVQIERREKFRFDQEPRPVVRLSPS